MSDFNNTPSSIQNDEGDHSDFYNGVMEALNHEDEETDFVSEDEEVESAEFEEDEEDKVEDDEEDEDEATEEEEPEVEDDEEDEDDEEESSEDEEDSRAQSIADGLQSQADACAQMLSQHGLDYNALCKEYLEDGELSKNSIEALEKAGYSKDLIKGYIDGQQARYEVYAQHVMKIAGGEKEYQKLTEWAADNLTEKEIKRFNKAVESNDIDDARFAIEGLMARREKTQGVKPHLVHGKTVSKASVKGFSSLAEQAKAQRDPRYEIDPEYTRKVDRRIMASNY